MAQFFKTEAAHEQIEIGGRCESYPNATLRKCAGKSAKSPAKSLKGWFEGALKGFRAKQRRLQLEAQEAAEGATTLAAAAPWPTASFSGRPRISRAPLPDIGLSTGFLGLSNQAWMRDNALQAPQDALLAYLPSESGV